MAFKKGAPQAQKGKPKGAQTGKKAPPQKNLLAAKTEEDDDLDEEDEDDMDFNEESDLSGADEDLDDEELDDEELDDEEDEDEEESEEEEAGGVQQQKTPAKAAVNGKRKAEDESGPSSPKRLRLQDHIPPEQVIDYEARDMCDVKLADFVGDVTEDDVKNLCKGAVEVRSRKDKNKLTCAFVRYADKDKAVAAVQVLQGAKLKGHPFKVTYCGTRWANPATRPEVLPTTLDVRGLPKPLLDKNKLAALYPTGQVLKVFRDGYAQVRFPTTDALIKAVKEPSGRTVDGTQLRLAVAIYCKDKHSGQVNVGKKSPPSTKLPPSTRRANRPRQRRTGGRSDMKDQSPGQKGTPGTKGSPKTPQQQKGKSPGQKGGPKTPGKQASPKTPGKQASPKTPGKQASPKTLGKQASPKTPGKQRGSRTPGQAKIGAATPKSTSKGTPFQKKTPKGTPAKA